MPMSIQQEIAIELGKAVDGLKQLEYSIAIIIDVKDGEPLPCIAIYP